MVMEETWMPFTEKQLDDHFIEHGSKGPDGLTGHLKGFRKSINKYQDDFLNNPKKYDQPVGDLVGPCQIEKDEEFWTASTLMNLYYSSTRVEDLTKAFKIAFNSDTPPSKYFKTWEECFTGDLVLLFELNMSSPPSYLNWLKRNRLDRHFVPYVLKGRMNEEVLEGKSWIDAVFINRDNGFSVLIESKVESDISVHIRYDALRDQMIRLIDFMIEPRISKQITNLHFEPEKILTILLTPKIIKEHPSSRLYGMKYREFSKNPKSIGDDMPHRTNIDWSSISKRIGWLTWEDCNAVNPKCCPWVKK
jgi:hypothetical protein